MSTTATTAPERDRSFDIEALPLRRPGRWIWAIVLVLFAAWFTQALATNKNIDYSVVGTYLFKQDIVLGVGLTLVITAVSMLISTVLAVVLAAMRLSGNPVMVVFSSFYVWLFRGTPLLVQIVIWGYFGLIFEKISIGIPFTDVVFWQQDTNTLLTPLVAGIIALTLNEAAYSAEIVRSGMLSVDSGQSEAAASLGMSPLATFVRILLPQAMRVIIPPLGNELISMVKNTSLLSLIAVMEVYTRATQISAQNLKQVELLIVVSLWYLLIVSLLSVPQYYLERHFGRGVERNAPATPLQKAKEFTGAIAVQLQGGRKKGARSNG
ncbi:ABC transporter permease [Leucobacter sp. OLJS4]|uniref:amino acid ABC transporter permease n=1 Tax=unclassified Leucobacter TaxID=2621730 RepID=UPI000C197D18|nr:MULTISPECIES: amino acid ABC transporter permease [unclassified Leucobacter]PIJ53255.1 ABC transporter permease [Leucobacter sp. OLES1]PII83193.1 ABC transporter permease [Leucobacter sp. OLCALW19]PII86744.1 ABC transporter permease [Leucobacter sp. OLTLW20]PII91320.1 ABC transporter permease [Leucobacter sp. OLAS13]PII98780.1 ABC transporter permease [Leucobacter sp. OLDS2]